MATVLKVIVKGDKFAAARAASARGLPFAFKKESIYAGDWTTIGLVGVQWEDVVRAWFSEPAQPPYPEGTCLFYNEVDEEAGVGWQPKTGAKCGCKRGVERDNCPQCEGTGMVIDFAAIRERGRKLREQREGACPTS